MNNNQLERRYCKRCKKELSAETKGKYCADCKAKNREKATKIWATVGTTATAVTIFVVKVITGKKGSGKQG